VDRTWRTDWKNSQPRRVKRYVKRYFVIHCVNMDKYCWSTEKKATKAVWWAYTGMELILPGWQPHL
jgi:hypothetical protein